MGKSGRIRRGESSGKKRARRKPVDSFSRDQARSASPLVQSVVPTLRFPKHNPTTSPRFPTAAVIAFGCLTLACLSAGCNGVHKQQTDPLFGNVKPQPGLNSTNASPVPPLPGPTSTGSTAALASVNPRPIDASHDLRITDPQPSANLTSNNTANPGGWGTASPSGSAPGSGTQLQQPVTGFAPTPDAHARPPVGLASAPSVNGPVPPNGNLTYEAAQAQLTARGVTWQRLESWGDQGDWKFTCSIPNKQNQYISRTYEAEARDPLSAIRGVLDQLDHDQR